MSAIPEDIMKAANECVAQFRWSNDNQWHLFVARALLDERASLTAEITRLRETLNECQTQAVKDGNEISNLKAWQAGAISYFTDEKAGIFTGKLSEATRRRRYLERLSELTRLREALGQIAAPRDCGCSPACQCDTEEALRVEVDYLKDLARAALSPDNSTQKKEG